ncbi:MAG: rhodanese-like domain-containing protein [Gemmatimonadetes bacterium]|nr:rhodanese-like domain-containing protein [Gemmatimonadota bacterium]
MRTRRDSNPEEPFPVEIPSARLADLTPDKVVLVDVRTPGEYQTAHIPDAENFPLNSLSSAGANLASAARERGVSLCLICRSGARARQAVASLLAAGIPANQISILSGGVAAWEQEGRPLVRGQRRTLPLDAQVRIAAGSVVLTGAFLALLVHPLLVLVSAFAGAGLVMAGFTGLCPMANLLAAMPWNRGDDAPTTSCNITSRTRK